MLKDKEKCYFKITELSKCDRGLALSAHFKILVTQSIPVFLLVVHNNLNQYISRFYSLIILYLNVCLYMYYKTQGLNIYH